MKRQLQGGFELSSAGRDDRTPCHTIQMRMHSSAENYTKELIKFRLCLEQKHLHTDLINSLHAS
jgi:hypothetical protein